MAQINPALPTVGGDADVWGQRNNEVHAKVIAQVNLHDTAIETNKSAIAALTGQITVTENTTGLREAVQDIVGAMFIGSGITFVYDDDAGKITATVTGSSGGGVTPVQLTSTSAPVLSGTTTVGNALTVTNGSWSATPDSYSRQWKRDGVNISGATNAVYTLVDADAGKSILCTITAVKSGYTSGTANSNSVTPTASTTPPSTSGYLLTESGAVLTTESGDRLLAA